jgi:hypothetical protein
MVLALLVSIGCTPTAAPTDGDTAAPPGTYANVVLIFNGSCAISSSCHSGTGIGQGHLNLQTSIMGGTLVHDLMRPSCEYSAMPLLTPGDPMNSWIYLKSTGHSDSNQNLVFTPSSTWDHGGLTPDAMGRYPTSTCPLTDMSSHITFGQVMPMGTTGLTSLQAETLRQWIANGAPSM